MPTVEMLTNSTSSESDRQAAAVFTALVGLSDVLLDCLDIVHCVTYNPGSFLWGLDNRLQTWTEATTGGLRRILLRGSDFSWPGAANLRLAYPSVRFFHNRLALEHQRLSMADTTEVKDQYYQTRWAAEEIVILLQELRRENIQDFWLPQLAFSITSIMFFLMRSAIQLEDTSVGLASNGALILARDLMVALRMHKQRDGWDLGDTCLTQYSDVLDKIEAMGLWVDPGLFDPTLLESLVSDVSFEDNVFLPHI